MKTRSKSRRLDSCKSLVLRHFGRKLPDVALVLGSGFGDVPGRMKVKAELSFAELPGFIVPEVKGHAGRLMVGEIEGMDFLIMSGRPHFYEGHSMEAVIFPIELLAECGVREVLLTNAAGGINRNFRPGDFMLFADHINMVGVNPLRGFPVAEGRSFVDLTDTYCQRLRKDLKRAAKRAGIQLREGVYIGVSGPTYETPAEIRAFRKLGADAVGMSTIPEVLAARYHGMRVGAISCITNLASGMSRTKLSHREVLERGEKSAQNASDLLHAFARIRKAQTGETS